MHDFKVLQGRFADEVTVLRAVSLAKLVFPTCYETVPATFISWFRANKDIITCLLDRDTVIGYFAIIPLRSDYYALIRSGQFESDSLLPAEAVESYSKGLLYNVHIFDIVMHPDYHGSKAYKHLLKGVFENIETLLSEGICFGTIMADVISPQGDKACSSLGLKKITDSGHGSMVFETTLENMLRTYMKRIR